ncbi:MAG TPA: hypothetical protein VGI39_24800 [Polyangiaceae bacterium]|jgi:lysophospholipid acyltransferase (LPLAT)-like uncharacterized protein
MKGLIHPDVPHQAPRYAPWLEPLFKATNLGVFAAMRGIASTAKVELSPLPLTDARPALFLAWHRYNYVCALTLRALPRDARPTLVMHDGIASRALTHESSVWFGFETLVFRRRSPVPPRQQIIDYVRRTGRSLVVLPDSGGPYGRMKPGTIEIAEATGAVLVPFTVRAVGTATLGHTLRHVVPLPGCRLSVVFGAPLNVREPREATVEDCQRSLDDLERS